MAKSLGHSSVTMVDTEVRYRIPQTGFEFRGEFVNVGWAAPAICGPTTMATRRIMSEITCGAARSKRPIILT